MDIPYGFDCYTFADKEVKRFDRRDMVTVREAHMLSNNVSSREAHAGLALADDGRRVGPYVTFARKKEHYTSEQLDTLTRAGRVDAGELATGKQVFCGIKIQIGVGSITGFVGSGLQFKRPHTIRSEFVNGTWTGIVGGLTKPTQQPDGYDMAFGNFFGFHEELPYIKFGPFLHIESKLVLLTGRSSHVETSSFGTNISTDTWCMLILALITMSMLAGLHIRSRNRLQHTRITKQRDDARTIMARLLTEAKEVVRYAHDFWLIYYTMLLNKPSQEFDEIVWPSRHLAYVRRRQMRASHYRWHRVMQRAGGNTQRPQRPPMVAQPKVPTSVRALSYLWSAASLVLASIYSGEMLAVILLQTDSNIDTVAQLLEAQPPIEPVIRQDDFIHDLMPKNADMVALHNVTRTVSRALVYTPEFIEQVAERKIALLADDELCWTLFNIYGRHYPLYVSRTTYFKYPISLIYRKDLEPRVERALTRGYRQMLEMGLLHRFWAAQQETYMMFYQAANKTKTTKSKQSASAAPAKQAAEQKYKPMSMAHFASFAQLMLACIAFAFVVLGLELLVHAHQQRKVARAAGNRWTQRVAALESGGGDDDNGASSDLCASLARMQVGAQRA